MGTITTDVSKQIDLLDGDVERYSELAKKNQAVYRSLNGYIASRLKELNKETKYSLAARLGVDDSTLNNWEQKGITEAWEAFVLAVALKLDADSVVEFIQKATGRGIYLADEEHFRYVYMLHHRADLEKKFPYETGETVIQWTNRVNSLLPIQKGFCQGWMETETFKQAIKTGNTALMQVLPFRAAGEKALVFLDAQIEGTPFEYNYGNKTIAYVQTDLENAEKNVSLSKNIFFNKEKSFLDYVIDQLYLGKIPHRYEIIELGMILRLTYDQMNELLELCGENSLYARNIYEGALLSVWKFLSEMCPEWFEEKGSFFFADELENIEQKEKIYIRDYKNEHKYGGPLDFCVLASRQVEKALQGLPEKDFKKVLKEKPSWYLNKEERKLRLDERRLSTIFYEMLARIQMIRNRVNEAQRSYTVSEQTIEVWVSKEVSIQIDYSLMRVLDKLEEDYGYHEIKEDEEAEILRMMQQLDAEWKSAVRNKNVLGEKSQEFIQFKDTLYRKMGELYKAYFKAYVPNLKDFEIEGETWDDECDTVE